jgi:GNAT superfamily N-acetyltransferase
VELSAAQSFAGHDVPDRVFSDFTPPEDWRGRQQTGTLWVAEAEGAIVAFLGAQGEGERLHIDEFAVAQGRQAQGLGRRMLATVADWARANGFTALSLTTFRAVPFNGPFYESFGFRDWPEAEAPAGIRQRLAHEADAGLKDRCAMRMDL